MTNLEMLDPSALATIHGGVPAARPAQRPVAPLPPARPVEHGPAVAPNRNQVSTNLGVATVPVRVGLQVDWESQRSNYAHCLGLAERMHATPAQIPAMCGLPHD